MLFGHKLQSKVVTQGRGSEIAVPRLNKGTDFRVIQWKLPLDQVLRRFRNQTLQCHRLHVK